MKPALFVSDLHLSPARPAMQEAFERFCAVPARGASALWVLGDLFDAWAGDEQLADPLPSRAAAALAAVAAAGTAVAVMRGNRDLLLGERFAAAAGARLLPDAIVAPIAGTPTLLLHGDTLCTDDVDYQAVRKVLRSPAWKQGILALPLTERKKKIEGLREQSEAAKGGKNYELMDANTDAVIAAFRDHGVARMIHGHTHRQARHEHIVDGRSCERWVLGDWHASGNALACDADGCRWRTISK
jgi:UDP-2,3-diacylglucosamine hydrolase